MTAADLEAVLDTLRRGDRYRVPSPRDDNGASDRVRLAEMLNWSLRQPPRLNSAHDAALALVRAFPQCRVNFRALADDLLEIVSDGALPPGVVWAVIRRIRAEHRALPPISMLREMLIREKHARQALLAELTAAIRAPAAT